MYFAFNITQEDFDKYYQDRAERMRKYQQHGRFVIESTEKFIDKRNTLERDGVLKAPGFFPREKVLALGRAVEGFIEKREHLSRVRNPSKETPEGVENGEFVFYDPEEIQDPSFPLRENTKAVAIRDPLINLPELHDLVFDENLIGLLSSCYQVVPVLSFVKIMCSFVNDLPPATDTQLFHVDTGSYRIIKALIYLDDVGPGGGPFEYVRSSHHRKFKGWHERFRYTKEEMNERFGDDQDVVECYGQAGDLLLAETIGYHRGIKPEVKERKICIVTYCVHPEYGFRYPQCRIESGTMDRLSDVGRSVADALQVI